MSAAEGGGSGGSGGSGDGGGSGGGRGSGGGSSGGSSSVASGKRRIGDESTAPARHVAGLWIGEAAPAPELAASVPVNPITWSLALNPDAVPPAPSAVRQLS